MELIGRADSSPDLSPRVQNIKVAAWQEPQENSEADRTLPDDCTKRDLDKCLQVLRADPVELSAEINNLANKGDIDKIEIVLGFNSDFSDCCQRHLQVAKQIKDEVFRFQESARTKHALSLALMTACVNGIDSLIDILVKGGADPNGQDRNGFTPLLEAYDHNNIDIVEKLLLLGAMKPAGITDAHLYCLLGREVGTVRADSLNQTTAEAKDFKRRLPIHVAARAGHTDLVEKCLEFSSSKGLYAKDQFGRTPFHYGARGGHMAVVELLLGRGYNLSSHNRKDKEGRSPLHYAAMDGHAPVISQLLAAGEKVDVHTKSQSTPLHLAARMRHMEAVVILLKNGANPNAWDDNRCTPIFEACATSIDENVDHAYTVVEQIILHGGDPTSGKCNPLAVAENERLIKLLLAHGASVDMPSNSHDGMLPIHNACSQRNSQKLKMVIEAGSPLNATSWSGVTPLHLACLANFIEAIFLLIIHGADLNLKTNEGLTALHYVAKHSNPNPEAMKILLSRRVNMNPVDNNGQTPFDILVTKAISILEIPEKLNLLVNAGCLLTSLERHLSILCDRRNTTDGEDEEKWRTVFKYLLLQTSGHVITLDDTIQSNIAKICDADMADFLRTIGFKFSSVFWAALDENPDAEKIKLLASSPAELKNLSRVAVRGLLSHSGALKGQPKGPIKKVMTMIKNRSKSHPVTSYTAVRAKDVTSLPVSQQLQDFLLFRDLFETQISDLKLP